MYDPQKAMTRGYLFSCTAAMQESVTVSGTYRCQEGHDHKIFWHHGRLYVQEQGFDADFLQAHETAWDAATGEYDPDREPTDFRRVYEAVMHNRGYGDVLPD